ncbi:hypothetical protein D3C73_907720 [compost metagenome]
MEEVLVVGLGLAIPLRGRHQDPLRRQAAAVALDETSRKPRPRDEALYTIAASAVTGLGRTVPLWVVTR